MMRAIVISDKMYFRIPLEQGLRQNNTISAIAAFVFSYSIRTRIKTTAPQESLCKAMYFRIPLEQGLRPKACFVPRTGKSILVFH